ncbi:unnamed protein product [Somion occarium]|uniref:MYND-type domain-containing protein n=1 Tax=Somion occarium TaxID=3059160 RepID=A0ABP1E771_9APHY
MPTTLENRCDTCDVHGRRKPLQKCAGCGISRYCSKECQKKDWVVHKIACQMNTLYVDMLKHQDSTPMGRMLCAGLPDDLTMHELDNRLAKWVRFHTTNLVIACFIAIRINDDLDNCNKEVLYISVRPRPQSEHEGYPGKYFAIKDAYPVNIQTTMHWPMPWPPTLLQLQEVQRARESEGRGRVAGYIISLRPSTVDHSPNRESIRHS